MTKLQLFSYLNIFGGCKLTLFRKAYVIYDLCLGLTFKFKLKARTTAFLTILITVVLYITIYCTMFKPLLRPCSPTVPSISSLCMWEGETKPWFKCHWKFVLVARTNAGVRSILLYNHVKRYWEKSEGRTTCRLHRKSPKISSTETQVGHDDGVFSLSLIVTGQNISCYFWYHSMMAMCRLSFK